MIFLFFLFYKGVVKSHFDLRPKQISVSSKGKDHLSLFSLFSDRTQFTGSKSGVNEILISRYT